MLEALSKKQKTIFFIILTIMIIVIIYYIYFSLYNNNLNFSYTNNTLIDTTFIENSSTLENSTLNSLSSNFIVVYICGAVNESKVITLNENSRICDAIDAVGGLTQDADLTHINLAYILEDGEKIYIPKIGEELNSDSTFTSSASSYSSYNLSSNSIKKQKININKATQTELELIPGIGPSTAFKILDYREKNGKFSSIDEIKNVSGIGDVKFEQIKDYICIK